MGDDFGGGLGAEEHAEALGNKDEEALGLPADGGGGLFVHVDLAGDVKGMVA